MARLALAVAPLLLLLLATAVEGLGVNWGTQASHPLPPKVVVQLLRDNGIKKVKLFETNLDAMRALAGSGIETMLAIPNNMLHDIAQDSGAAKDWVKRNVKRFDFDGGVVIKSALLSLSLCIGRHYLSSCLISYPFLDEITFLSCLVHTVTKL
jgi:hypothetical protein